MKPPLDPDFLAGRLLIAMPGIADERFERAVIYVCAHDDQHAMGITLNRPVDGLTMPDLLTRLGVKVGDNSREDIVLMGGPVERERGFVLHTDDYVSPAGTLPVAAGVALTTSREVLNALAADGAPRKAILALGYAGWGAGQLEQEMRDNIWLVGEADPGLIFGDDHEHKWSRALAGLGVSADHLSAQ
ncbi:MAG: YqgE/AlgH family protein, partial [Caulobacteraceae bacterium]|nr:YqgE/AlgH family protein [Caulobacteraceae bacterium]